MFGKNKNKKAHPVHLYRKNTLSKKKRRSSKNKKGESVRQKKERVSLIESVYWIGVMGFVGYAVYIFIFSPYVLLRDIHIEGNEIVSHDAVREEIDIYQSTKALFIFPRTYFFFSEETLEKNIKEKFVAAKEVSVEKEFPHGIYITLQEYIPEIAWCQNEVCFMLDAYGEAFQEMQKDNIAEGVTIIQNTSFQNITVGESFTSPERIQFFTATLDTFQEKTSLEIERELYIKSVLGGECELQTSQGWKIFLSTEIPVEKSLHMFQMFVANYLEDELEEKLEYVDLRIENKIFYKVEQEETEEVCEEEDEACQERMEETNQGE